MSGRALDVLAHVRRTEAEAAEAHQYVDYLGLEPPCDGEGVRAFCERVAGELRDRGMVIEAHEALRGRRWDAPDDPGIGDPGSVLTGVAGHVALGMGGGPLSRDGCSQVGDELAAGVLATNPDPGRDALAAAFDLLGPGPTMDLLGGGS